MIHDKVVRREPDPSEFTPARVDDFHGRAYRVCDLFDDVLSRVPVELVRSNRRVNKYGRNVHEFWTRWRGMSEVSVLAEEFAMNACKNDGRSVKEASSRERIGPRLETLSAPIDPVVVRSLETVNVISECAPKVGRGLVLRIKLTVRCMRRHIALDVEKRRRQILEVTGGVYAKYVKHWIYGIGFVERHIDFSEIEEGLEISWQPMRPSKNAMLLRIQTST
jgi:hypothetical protein